MSGSQPEVRTPIASREVSPGEALEVARQYYRENNPTLRTQDQLRASIRGDGIDPVGVLGAPIFGGLVNVGRYGMAGLDTTLGRLGRSYDAGYNAVRGGGSFGSAFADKWQSYGGGVRDRWGLDQDRYAENAVADAANRDAVINGPWDDPRNDRLSTDSDSLISDQMNLAVSQTLADWNSSLTQLQDDYDEAVSDLERQRRHTNEQYQQTLAELDEQQAQYRETYGLNSEHIENEKGRLAEQHALSLEKLDLAQQQLASEREAREDDLASEIANNQALMGLFGRLSEENADMYRAAAEAVGVDPARVMQAGLDAQAAIGEGFDAAEASAREGASTELTAAAETALDGVISQMEGSIVEGVGLNTQRNVDMLLANSEVVKTGIVAAGEAAALRTDGAAAVANAESEARGARLEEILTQIGFEEKALDLAVDEEKLAYQQAIDRLNEDQERLDLAFSQQLRTLAMARQGHGLDYRQAMENLSDLFDDTEEGMDRALADLAEQWSSGAIGEHDFGMEVLDSLVGREFSDLTEVEQGRLFGALQYLIESETVVTQETFDTFLAGEAGLVFLDQGWSEQDIGFMRNAITTYAEATGLFRDTMGTGVDVDQWKADQGGSFDTSQLTKVPGGGQLARPAATAFMRMVESAAADGVNLVQYSDTYRSWETQDRAYRQWLATGTNLAGNPVPSIAPPGKSNHNWGLAVDFNLSDPKVYDWLKVNGNRFGWFQLPSERWHWEYKGAGGAGSPFVTGGSHTHSDGSTHSGSTHSPSEPSAPTGARGTGGSFS